MINNRSMEDIKRDLGSKIGTNIIIKERRIWNNEEKYNHPVEKTIQSVTNNYVITTGKNNFRTCYNFADFYCGDIRYEAVQHDGKR